MEHWSSLMFVKLLDVCYYQTHSLHLNLVFLRLGSVTARASNLAADSTLMWCSNGLSGVNTIVAAATWDITSEDRRRSGATSIWWECGLACISSKLVGAIYTRILTNSFRVQRKGKCFCEKVHRKMDCTSFGEERYTKCNLLIKLMVFKGFFYYLIWGIFRRHLLVFERGIVMSTNKEWCRGVFVGWFVHVYFDLPLSGFSYIIVFITGRSLTCNFRRWNKPTHGYIEIRGLFWIWWVASFPSIINVLYPSNTASVLEICS